VQHQHGADVVVLQQPERGALDPARMAQALDQCPGQGGLPGTGNPLVCTPTFVDADGDDGVPGTPDDDLHLTAGSDGIDAGDANLCHPDALDLDRDGDTTELMPVDADSSPRVAGENVDMGAFEFQP